MTKYICIHGHFYQPPRENAWLEVIEQQDSAYPFHDWNERISHESYSPNGFSRILDEDDNIVNIVNNYERISFNFGPTLLQWMEIYDAKAYQAVIDADERSRLKNNGHGNALAQVYNHIIMPLANRRDKETQVIWGIRDFESRFRRKPEGMWLAETAVDTETLEVLAENGIKFTILAPRQAHEIKPKNGEWMDVSGERIDTRKPYLYNLPSGKTISLFFYDGSISQDIAFKGLLIDGKEFARRLTEDQSLQEPHLVHVATDGESYGHHHLHGDMALAFCLDYIEKNKLGTIINYANYLEKFPPIDEVRIYDNSSWSCVHGIERWRTDCGCSSGMNAGWHQLWRAPLRNALDNLRNDLKGVFEKELSLYIQDPWKARNDYISIVLDRSDARLEAFFLKHCKSVPEGDHKTKVIRLLEMQRNEMLMYTSCGWFFDEISGIETTQILQYANRAIQLAESESSIVLEKDFLQQLELAPSNVPALKNGANIHKEYVQPSRLTLSRVGSHYAVASLFDDIPELMNICNYRAESDDYLRLEAGTLRMAVGQTRVHSLITHSVKKFYFAVIWLGQNHILGNSSSFIEAGAYANMKAEITEAFNDSKVAGVIGIMQTYFGPEKFSLWNLFKDEQRKVLNQIIRKDVIQAEEDFRSIYRRHYNIMKVMSNARLPIPKVLLNNLENVVNADLRHLFENGNLYITRLEQLAADAISWEVKLDETSISFAASEKMYHLLRVLQLNETGIRELDTIISVFKVMKQLGIELDIVEFQNEYFSKGEMVLSQPQILSFKDQASKIEWIKKYLEIGSWVKVKLPERMKSLLSVFAQSQEFEL
jgi:alpha-amylase/alpha-mannosidase (GH57 family)